MAQITTNAKEKESSSALPTFLVPSKPRNQPAMILGFGCAAWLSRTLAELLPESNVSHLVAHAGLHGGHLYTAVAQLIAEENDGALPYGSRFLVAFSCWYYISSCCRALLHQLTRAALLFVALARALGVSVSEIYGSFVRGYLHLGQFCQPLVIRLSEYCTASFSSVDALPH